ncbi:MAG: hypothetical protein H0X50_09805 [Nitrosopumilus sp.]|nr:hypothetical protein [Nitrosopumilus sp.]
MSPSIDTLFSQNLKVPHAAFSINSKKRMEIGINAIKGLTPISHVACHFDVSRKFVYEQKEKALEGINQAFGESVKDSGNVLFHIPVTKKWLEQTLLGLIFICRSSYQGVIEFFRDLFDYDISKGTIHNIVYKHLNVAKEINQRQDLSRVTVGLHDEIYQAGNPVLVGCCARSTYCYLLKFEEVCDANSWGVHLLDLKEKQRLAPDFTVIDGGQAARKGQQDAWSEIPAHGDVFHALKPFLELVIFLENRALVALKIVDDLNHQIKGRKGKWKDENNRLTLYCKLLEAEDAGKRAASLADDINILYKWLKNDILSLIGPSYAVRQELLMFVVEQLRSLESLYPLKIGPVRTYLENHMNNLLAFVPIMEMYFHEIALEFEVPLTSVVAMYELKGMPSASKKHWKKYNELQAALKQKFYWIESMVNEVLEGTVRANSLVENLNSRLRTYFTLRRELGNEYLEFLQFFLNHRRFMRSTCSKRVGKSPTELLTGVKHKHWLEMLHFELFKQAA